MHGLLGVPLWLATVLLMTWAIGLLGVVALAAALVRGDRAIVVSDPHEAAIFTATRARQWDVTAARLVPAPGVVEALRSV